MTRITLRRFDIVRTANVVAALYGLLAVVFGLFIFIPIALIGGIASTAGDGNGALVAGGLVGGLIFYVFIVAFYAVVGWIFAAIGCAAYNFVAGRIGGFRVEVTMEGPGGGAGYPAQGYGAPGYPSAGYPAQVPNPYPPGYNPPPG